MRVLIFGKRSYVAKDLEHELIANEIDVTWFSRGNVSMDNNTIFGTTENINNNQYITGNFDCFINLMVLKDQNIEKNTIFVSDLLELAKKCGVKKFLHFSSVMVYPYNEEIIDEFSSVESLESTWKPNYAKIKIGVDMFIESKRKQYEFDIILIRPGFVFCEEREPNFSLKISQNIILLVGDRNSVLPTIEKKELHKNLVSCILQNNLPEVIHLFNHGGTNRFFFTREKYPSMLLLSINSLFFKLLPKKLFSFSDFTRVQYSRIESAFMRTKFYSTTSLTKLNKPNK